MKLWRISQTERDGYDTYDSAVVAAPDEEAARLTHPEGETGWKDGFRGYLWCPKPQDVKVELIGEAAPGVEPGVICASFNAG